LNYLQQGAIWFVLANVYRGIQGFEAVVIELEDKFKDFISALKTNNALLIQPNNAMPKSAHSTRRDVVFHTDPNKELW
jgi:hypothetical protein